MIQGRAGGQGCSGRAIQGFSSTDVVPVSPTSAQACWIHCYLPTGLFLPGDKDGIWKFIEAPKSGLLETHGNKRGRIPAFLSSLKAMTVPPPP